MWKVKFKSQVYEDQDWRVPRPGFRCTKTGARIYQGQDSSVPRLGLRCTKTGAFVYQGQDSHVPRPGFRCTKTGARIYQGQDSSVPRSGLRCTKTGDFVYQGQDSSLPRPGLGCTKTGTHVYQDQDSCVLRPGLRKLNLDMFQDWTPVSSSPILQLADTWLDQRSLVKVIAIFVAKAFRLWRRTLRMRNLIILLGILLFTESFALSSLVKRELLFRWDWAT